MRRREFLKTSLAPLLAASCGRGSSGPPNIVFLLTDDQRYDALGCTGNPIIRTPNMNRLAARGILFRQACVTLSICSPSRAACLTGRYGSATGVDRLVGPSQPRMHPSERTYAHLLRNAGYRTGHVGKWHLGLTPEDLGFERDVHFFSNGPWYGRTVNDNGTDVVVGEFIEDYLADCAVEFIQASVNSGQPFLLEWCSQVPHMTDRRTWDARPETLAMYSPADIPLPANMYDDLTDKPPYLRTGRPRVQGKEDGFQNADGIRRSTAAYWASITDLDRSIGRLIDALQTMGILDNTWILLMGDNGWFMGEHGFTSKVLAYEESMRVPMIVSGPGLNGVTSDALALNIDIAPTILDLAGLAVPETMHGRSLAPVWRYPDAPVRSDQYYEAPVSQLGSWPLYALRTREWKYIQTYDLQKPAKLVFEELYHLREDPGELHNRAEESPDRAAAMRRDLEARRAELSAG